MMHKQHEIPAVRPPPFIMSDPHKRWRQSATAPLDPEWSLHSLPQELLLLVLAYLDDTSLSRIRQTGRYLYVMGYDEVLWQHRTFDALTQRLAMIELDGMKGRYLKKLCDTSPHHYLIHHITSTEPFRTLLREKLTDNTDFYYLGLEATPEDTHWRDTLYDAKALQTLGAAPLHALAHQLLVLADKIEAHDEATFARYRVDRSKTDKATRVWLIVSVRDIAHYMLHQPVILRQLREAPDFPSIVLRLSQLSCLNRFLYRIDKPSAQQLSEGYRPRLIHYLLSQEEFVTAHNVPQRLADVLFYPDPHHALRVDIFAQYADWLQTRVGRPSLARNAHLFPNDDLETLMFHLRATCTYRHHSQQFSLTDINRLAAHPVLFGMLLTIDYLWEQFRHVYQHPFILGVQYTHHPARDPTNAQKGYYHLQLLTYYDDRFYAHNAQVPDWEARMPEQSGMWAGSLNDYQPHNLVTFLTQQARRHTYPRLLESPLKPTPQDNPWDHFFFPPPGPTQVPMPTPPSLWETLWEWRGPVLWALFAVGLIIAAGLAAHLYGLVTIPFLAALATDTLVNVVLVAASLTLIAGLSSVWQTLWEWRSPVLGGLAALGVLITAGLAAHLYGLVAIPFLAALATDTLVNAVLVAASLTLTAVLCLTLDWLFTPEDPSQKNTHHQAPSRESASPNTHTSRDSSADTPSPHWESSPTPPSPSQEPRSTPRTIADALEDAWQQRPYGLRHTPVIFSHGDQQQFHLFMDCGYLRKYYDQLPEDMLLPDAQQLASTVQIRDPGPHPILPGIPLQAPTL